jgi:nucleoside-diphosphate-sugar epimerase
VRRALVFGLSGQIGAALLEPLRADGWELVAVSRTPRPEAPGVRWVVGALPDAPVLAEPFDAVLSLGPLDGFAAAAVRHPPVAPRVVAIGSTGLRSKADSPDPVERALATRLADAEGVLGAVLAGRSALAVLRPTLVYGSGRDGTLTPLVDFARRRGWLVLPRGAVGLRQPVHVDDIAAAVLACLRAPAPIEARLDLPGAEALPFDAMVARTLARHAPGTRVWRVPASLFRLGVRLAGRRAPAAVSAPGFLGRLRRDQVFDVGPVRAALGVEPRAFDP